MRVVLDTDVALSGPRSTIGASRLLLEAVDAEALTLLISVPVVLEYEAVLKRPGNLSATGLNALEVDTFLDALIARADHVGTWYRWRPSIRDPDDELFVDLAINGAAEAIVTFNVRDYMSVGIPLERLGVDVLRPREFLRRLLWRP